MTPHTHTRAHTHTHKPSLSYPYADVCVCVHTHNRKSLESLNTIEVTLIMYIKHLYINLIYVFKTVF